MTTTKPDTKLDTKPAIIAPRHAPGTQEFLPQQQVAFQRLLDVIRTTYERYGFLPVETPVFELTDVLLTKSGGETEKQVYFASKTGSLEKDRTLNRMPELALRFDLTVPLARYVAQYEHALTFPFRRYQMQRVYRGERPQRGRYNEFYQCDIDVIGKDSLSSTYDAELPAIICDIFTALGFQDFTINFSNRKILLGYLESQNTTPEQRVLALREVDKIDKIGAAKVAEALQALQLPTPLIEQLLQLIAPDATNAATLAKIKALAATVPAATQLHEGLHELQTMCTALAALGVPEKHARLNLKIVRGLDYYTGTVYETLLNSHPEFGSVCSGGRYENLAGYYTKSRLPGVGLSIGASRLFDIWQEVVASQPQYAAPETLLQVLVTVMDEALLPDYLHLAQRLRQAGLITEVFFEGGKMAKQMKYADRAKVPLVLVMGSDEKQKGTFTLKNMKTGQQTQHALTAAVPAVQAALQA